MTFGEMLLTGISEANKRFEEMQSELRFTEREDLLQVAERDLLFEMFSAKKKTGKPKEDDPSKSNTLFYSFNDEECEEGFRNLLILCLY